MSYRSFKRVLGETSLERKCRILFGISLLLLITIAFCLAERIAENLVTEKTRVQAQDFVDLSLLRYHYEHVIRHYEQDEQAGVLRAPDGLLNVLRRQVLREIDDAIQSLDRPPDEQQVTATVDRLRDIQRVIEGATSPADGGTGTGVPEAPFAALYARLNDELLTVKYQWEILVRDLDNPLVGSLISDTRGKVREPRGEREARIYAWFMERAQAEQLASGGSSAPGNETDAARPASAVPGPDEVVGDVTGAGDDTALWRLERVGNTYEYYRPVVWKENCRHCHLDRLRLGALTGHDLAAVGSLRLPVEIVKVVMPNDETQKVIGASRASLAVTGIVTVSLAMLALYVVVRYVIVKPLKHLRDVSDEIVRGNYNVRADIQTNDEFEEMAESFNRMLRHLVDTQQELRQVNQDLDGKVDELARANMQLHEMNRLKSDFLANMSHELRTPLNSIIGFSDVLTGIPSLSDKQRRYVDNIRKSGRMLLDMINDILDLAKLESGKMEVRPSEFSMESVVVGQCDLVRSLTEEKNIDLEVYVEPDLPDMFQDRAKIQQILTNLLSNAIKFTPEGGRITVSATRLDASRGLLTVSDTGIGIAEEDRETIFEKFRQGSSTIGKDGLTREYSGTGLGLSIVKELSRLLGGEIRFDSEVGKGSTFYVELPWAIPVSARRDNSLASRLDQLTKARRTASSGNAILTGPRGGPLAGDSPGEPFP